MARRTKIVATIGPATRAPELIRALLDAGVDVFRLNLAHETHDAHARSAAAIRDEAAAAGRVAGLLMDLPGPKMRTGPIADDAVTLSTGASFALTAADVVGDDRRVSTSVVDLPRLVAVGDEIFLADGAIVLRVTGADDATVVTEVLRGGVLRSRKGLHLPEAERDLQAFTAADRAALEVAVSAKVDFVGLSFVRDADDVRRARDALPRRGHRPQLVAKIETRAALDHLPDIVSSADAVMVARGDLGIQAGTARVPLVQKRIVRLCNENGTPVITATQMLDSMTQSPLATRAEIADIANAVLDGTDALMLSEETAVGSYPIAAVQTMAEAALVAETHRREPDAPAGRHASDDRVSWAVAHAAVRAAEDLGVAAILCPTRSGATPRRVAAFRPTMPVVGLSSRPETLGPLTLTWGVVPLPMEEVPAERDMREDVERVAAAARGAGVIAAGDLVAVVAGSPGRRAGRTDFLRIVRA